LANQKFLSVLLPVLTAFVLEGCTSAPTNQHSRGHGKSGDSPSSEASHSTHSKDGQPSGSAQENREFREIEIAFSQSRLDEAQAKIRSFKKRHPKSSFSPSLENLLGLIRLREKQPEEAAAHFRKAIELNPDHRNFNQYILFNLATALFEAGHLEESHAAANEIDQSVLDKSNRMKVHYLKASIYEKKSLPLESSRQLLIAGKLFSEPDVKEDRKIFNKLLDQSLMNIPETETLEKLWDEFEASPAGDSVLFQLGSREIAQKNAQSGEAHLKTLMSQYPQSLYFAQASELIANSQSRTAVDSRSVGVLLPTKGKFSKFGNRSLQAIELAFGIFNLNEPDSKLNLVVEDSGEDPETAIRALNRLVLKHNVIAVIGPMLSKGVDQVTQRAQELGVPLISLSRKAGPQQEFVFNAGLTPQLQASEMARKAIHQFGLKRFVILHPNEKSGIEMSQSFWDAVEANGGKVVGIESYTSGETDFRVPVDKLSGLYYTDARQRELDELAQERVLNNIKKKTRKTEQYFNLKPIVDYDAVFIPDEAKVAGQILPTFAYRDVEHIKFLGTSSWYSPDFLSRAQAYGEESLFVDAYFPESDSAKSKKFFEKYKVTFDQEPTSLEAVAYDAGMILHSILTSSSGKISRSDLKDELKKIQGYPGLTGKIFYKDGQYFRDLRTLSVRNNHFVELP
jgi:ABC-type branched-subunit amino acid transport system substrate-binding protein